MAEISISSREDVQETLTSLDSLNAFIPWKTIFLLNVSNFALSEQRNCLIDLYIFASISDLQFN